MAEREEAAGMGKGRVEMRLCFPIHGLVSGEGLALSGALEGEAWVDGRSVSARSFENTEP